VSILTIPPPAADEDVLAQLEAEFLRCPSVWLSPSDVDLAQTLAPAIRRSYEPLCAEERGGTMVKSRNKKTCCD
jgi:hypothetical protein